MSWSPGWYPDPQNAALVRWWDGQAWTAHAKPAAPPAAAVPPPVPASAAWPPTPAAMPPRQAGADRSEDPHAALAAELVRMRAERAALQREIVDDRDVIALQEVGIYRYSHPLADSPAYKARLESIEGLIKDAVRAGGAVKGAKRWTINGSEQEGARMIADFSKLMLRAYNNEAENAVRAMKPYKLDAAVQRLVKTRATIGKLGASMHIEITEAYHKLRTAELELTADYLAKVAEEKENEREQRERLKEEEAARREFEREKARLEKEKAHYAAALTALRADPSANPDAIARAEAGIASADQAIQGVVERAANVRAGYVYVISNIGAFGDGVVKIGMTRRLEPLDRVRELGGASVPFRFDVHALVFSDDAVALETALHHAFAARRVNMINAHREFFYVTPLEVKAVLHQFRGDLLNFTDVPEALEWRQSENLRSASSAASEVEPVEPDLLDD